MSIINSILKVFVGDKAANDIKAIQPIVNKINSFQEGLKTISHDELRAKTAFFKDKIKQIKEDESLLNEFLWFLNVMVDLGSSKAYYIRENLILYKK